MAQVRGPALTPGLMGQSRLGHGARANLGLGSRPSASPHLSPIAPSNTESQSEFPALSMNLRVSKLKMGTTRGRHIKQRAQELYTRFTKPLYEPPLCPVCLSIHLCLSRVIAMNPFVTPTVPRTQLCRHSQDNHLHLPTMCWALSYEVLSWS